MIIDSNDRDQAEAAHRMVFGTMTAGAGVAPGDGQGRLISNRANDRFSDPEGGAKSPVDLPLRLDDASASPTTPQGQHPLSINFTTQKRSCGSAGGSMRQREHAW